MTARRVVALATAFGLLSSQAFAAGCTAPTDQAAFDVGALKSELSVMAVSCSDEDPYNQFVNRYRTRLVAEDKVVNAWFSKTYGRNAQKQYDAYITLLANEQSSDGLRQGTGFCPRLQPIFGEVMALPDAAVLAEFAAGKDLFPPNLAPCTAVGGTTVREASPSRRAPARHR